MNNPNFDLRSRRKELGLTLTNVGNHVGVSKGTVSKWENGNIKNMRSDKIALLAEVLRVSVMDILHIFKTDFHDDSNDFLLNDSDEAFIHPEDLAQKNRPVFLNSSDTDKRLIMYQDSDGNAVYEEFSKEDFAFILHTINMLKSKLPDSE